VTGTAKAGVTAVNGPAADRNATPVVDTGTDTGCITVWSKWLATVCGRRGVVLRIESGGCAGTDRRN
jgi:hypothetical protein